MNGGLVTRISLALALLTLGCAQSTTLAADAGADAARRDAGLSFPDTGELDAGCDISPVP